MGKFTIKDFGKIVKPKILIDAFILCKHENIDTDSWWRRIRKNASLSRTFKRDMIIGTYGMEFKELFSGLERDNFVCRINSFIVFHRGVYKLVENKEEIDKINDKCKIIICAIGVKFFNKFDKTSKETFEPWKITEDKQIIWMFSPRNLIPIENVHQYESAEMGDLVLYTKSHGFISKISNNRINSWWAKSSWTQKKVTVISGQNSKPHKLSIERPYKLIRKEK